MFFRNVLVRLQSAAPILLYRLQIIMKNAYCTLIGNDKYVIGALCLAESYKRLKLPHDFIFLVNENVSQEKLTLIYEYNFGIVKIIPDIKYKNDNSQNHFSTTTGKFETFALTDYDGIIFMDADTLLIYPIDILFKYDTWFAAQSSANKYCIGGTFKITPSKELYDKIQTIIKTKDFADDEAIFDYLKLDSQLSYSRQDLLYNNVFHDVFAYGKGDGLIPKYWMNNSDNYTLEDIPKLVNEQLQKIILYRGVGQR